MALVDIKSLIRDVPDFPKPGIVFKDITPVLLNPQAFLQVTDELTEAFAGQQVKTVVGIESRGFIFGAPVAHRLNAGLALARKKGKLPYKTVSASYDLEYGQDHIELHVDAIAPGDRVVIIDDLLATGGTAAATARLVQSQGGVVVGLGFVVELAFLKGRERLKGLPAVALVAY